MLRKRYDRQLFEGTGVGRLRKIGEYMRGGRYRGLKEETVKCNGNITNVYLERNAKFELSGIVSLDNLNKVTQVRRYRKFCSPY